MKERKFEGWNKVRKKERKKKERMKERERTKMANVCDNPTV